MKSIKRLLAVCLCLSLAGLPVPAGIRAEDAPPTRIAPAPGPIALSFHSIEQTLYLHGNNRQQVIWPIELASDVSAYGSVSWELTRESGNAVTLYLTDINETSCTVRCRDIIGVGSVSYFLTCRVSSFERTVPIRINISGETVPDTMLALQQVYTAMAGEWIFVPRPDLLPLSTDLPADVFQFELIIPGEAEDGVTHPEMTGGMHALQFETPGYYHGSIWMHNFSNIAFRHNLLFVITDAAGTVPGNPLKLLPAAMEETVYLQGNAVGFRLGRCQLQDAPYALGTPVWSVTPDIGDALTVAISNGRDESCEVVLAEMAHQGDAAFSVRCAIGAYSASIPALFHVSARSVPTSMSVSSNVYRAAAGEMVSVSRPELLPAGTGLSSDEFDFMVAMDPLIFNASLVSKGFDAIGLCFDNPGYYPGKITMREGNVTLSDDVMFIISDAGGAVPGSPIQLDRGIVEATVYLRGNAANAVIAQVHMQNTLDAALWNLPSAVFGEPVWSLNDMNGDAIMLRVEAGPPDECRLVADSIDHMGDVSGTLWCGSGGFNASVPVLIHVVSLPVPERMDTTDLYSAMVGEVIRIPCPDLLPEGTQPTESYFAPGLSGDAAFESAASWQMTKEGGIDLSFSAPGMYVASLSMSHSNIRVERDVRFDIIPAPVLTLDGVTLSARGIPPGGSVTATALASGGAGDTLHAFRAYRQGSATELHQPFGAGNSFVFVPAQAGLYTIQASAWDGRNLASVFSQSIAVDFAATLELRVSRDRLLTGEQAEVTASADRGSGEYIYAFQVIKDGVMLETPGLRQDFSPKNVFRFTPGQRGSYIVRATLDDGISRIWRDSVPITVSSPVIRKTDTPRPVTAVPPIPEPVTPVPVTAAPVTDPPIAPEPIPQQVITEPPVTMTPITNPPLTIIWPLAVSAQANTAFTATGQAVSVKAQASGGTGSYEYAFQVFKEGAVLGTSTSFSAKNAFSFTPAKPGSYQVLVIVRDGKNKASAYAGDINVK